MTNRLLSNKLLYDHYRNIKLLELYPNQNSQLGFESLNYGYSGIDINYNFNYEEPNFEMDYSTEGLIDTVKDLASRFWKWLKEFMSKLYKWVKEKIIKVIKFLKNLLYKVLGKKVNENMSQEDPNAIKEKVNELRKFLENKKIKLIPNNDFESIVNLSNFIFENFTKLLEKISSDIINTNKEGQDIVDLKNYPFKEAVKKYNLNLSGISDNLKAYLFGEKDDYAEEINGIQALKEISSINILNSTSSDQIVSGYKELLNDIKEHINVLENKYIPIITKTEKEFSNDHSTFAMTLSRKINKITNDIINNSNITIEEKQEKMDNVSRSWGLVGEFIQTLFKLPNLLIIRHCSTLTPFYNEVIRKIVTLFKSSDINLNEIIVSLKSTETIQKIFNMLKGKEVTRINEMPVYMAQDVVEAMEQSVEDNQLSNVMYSIKKMFRGLTDNLNAAHGVIEQYGVSMIVMGELLKEKTTEQEFKFYIGHEYGHYKNSHIAMTWVSFFNKLAKGKVSYNPWATNTARVDEQELEADLYGAKYTSPDIAISALKHLYDIVLKEYNEKDTEILKRIEFMKYIKKIGIDNVNNANIKEWLSKNQ